MQLRLQGIYALGLIHTSAFTTSTVPNEMIFS